MPTVNIEEVQPGMVLAADLMQGQRMLLPKGSVLTNKNISIFKNQNIESVDIVPEESEEPDEQNIDAAFIYARDYFMFVNHNDPVIMQMFDIAVYKTAVRLKEGWRLPTKQEQQVTALDDMRDMFFRAEGTFEDIVDAELKVASFPDIFFKVKEAVDDSSSSAGHIAEVVGLDVGLSTQLLKLVNSPLYGFPSKIDNLVRAVALIGGQELCTLALCLSTIGYFKDIPPELIDMRTFWMHSLTCGVFAKVLAEKVDGVNPEMMFTAGLLHDVGRLIMFKKMPYSAVQVMLFARENFLPLVEAEEVILDFNHTQVTRCMLEKWNFPPELTEIISSHHAPEKSEMYKAAGILQAADNLALAVGIAEGGMYVLPGVDDEVWEKLAIDVESLKTIVDAYDFQIKELFDNFFS